MTLCINVLVTLRQNRYYLIQLEYRENHVKNSNIQPDRKHFLVRVINLLQLKKCHIP